MQALPGTLSCGCCDCRYGHDRWALRTRLTCSIRLRISAGTHMRTENVAAFEKNCFFLLKVLQSEYSEYKGRKAPMPRPPRCRQICGVPQVDTFCPNGCENTEPILLTLDEYEVIQLVDLEQQPHEQCAAQMGISRSTVQEIYESARSKIAAYLVHGKPLHITGGNYHICGGQEAAHCGRCCRMQKANMEKSGKTCKGDSIMKIAVTYESGQIFQHFGHTEQFKLYEAADGKITHSIHHERNEIRRNSNRKKPDSCLCRWVRGTQQVHLFCIQGQEGRLWADRGTVPQNRW